MTISIKDLKDRYYKIIEQRDNENELNFANNKSIGNYHEIEKSLQNDGISIEDRLRMEKEAYEPMQQWFKRHPLKDKDGNPIKIEEYTGIFGKYDLRKKSRKIKPKTRKPIKNVNVNKNKHTFLYYQVLYLYR